MTPKKLPSAGLKRGAKLPPIRQKVKDHIAALRSLQEAFNGPVDFDLVELEAQAMQAAGIPPELIPGRDLIGDDHGHPIPGGGKA